MTELTEFLTALYDSVSEAETRALRHGQARLAQYLEAGAIPEDASVPVYHAADLEVTLDVCLQAEPTKEGMDIYMTEAAVDDDSRLSFTVDLFDLVDRTDLEDLEYGDVIPGPGDGPEGPESQSVDAVKGIGPQFSFDLEAHGVETIADLVELSPEEVAEIVSEEGAVVSPERARGWIEQARGMLAVLSGGRQPVEFVDDIGPAFGRRLREGDVEVLADLVERSPEDVAELASSDSLTISTERTAEWLEEAERLMAELETDEHHHGDERTGDEERAADERIDEEERREDERADEEPSGDERTDGGRPAADDSVTVDDSSAADSTPDESTTDHEPTPLDESTTDHEPAPPDEPTADADPTPEDH